MIDFIAGFEKKAWNILNRAATKSNTGTSSFFNFGSRGKSGTAAAPTQQAQRVASTPPSGGSRGGPNISTSNANAMRSAFGG